MKERLDRNGLDAAVVVALGCNLPGAYTSREALLDAAVSALAGEGMAVVARSGWWTSAAWPDPAGPAYLNGVVLVETALSPAEALEALHRIEAEFGRARAERNAARTLDLDLIAHGRTVTDGNLVLPHPRAHERLFVMGPLAEIAPGWVHPLLGARAGDLAAKASVGADARPQPHP
ncbi:2-amino-4-hydroxy-6-hydroxymethyldihydropteridine pyrophosphokinase [Caulobacter vibrioides]|nr:2-amino-4-hydroxy-6-hydroxymethyldihydropteridine pyrophosphokinase [Caulobacter vibrioides]